MTEPLKVILPPWRRGDGQPCKEPGWYAVKMNNPTGDGISEWCYKATDDVLHATNEYIGPVEYAVTEPEPEPLCPDGYFIRRRCGPRRGECGFDLSRNADGCLVVSTMGPTKKIAVEMFNAAVREMEGKQ